MTLEKNTLRLGYVALTDCLPLVVAREREFFAEQGLRVELCCEPSWANIRDKLIVGHLDGAQMLAPMPLAASLGIGGLKKNMLTAFSLGLNGNAITVSNRLFRDLQACAKSPDATGAALALAQVVRNRRERGGDALVLSTVFPFSSHNYLLRYWLAAGGIDPDRDIKLVALPPAQMVDNLRLEHIDGYCVGEPWNTCAVAMELGHVLVTGYDIWQNAPEKVLGVTEQWQARHPNTHAALLRALDGAAAWTEAHPRDALALLDKQHYLDVPLAWLERSLLGELPVGLNQQTCPPEQFHVWHRYHANFPWRSHALWFLRQMARWNQLPAGLDHQKLATQVYRGDLYREVFSATRNLPLRDEKTEGRHRACWSAAGIHGPVLLGPDRFIDDAIFPGGDS